jgi:hypothetical protein
MPPALFKNMMMSLKTRPRSLTAGALFKRKGVLQEIRKAPIMTRAASGAAEHIIAIILFIAGGALLLYATFCRHESVRDVETDGGLPGIARREGPIASVSALNSS